jgi:hypothetical protein
VKFTVSKSGFLANEAEGSPAFAVEIPVGEKLVILLKQYDPARVRFSWSGKHYWAFKHVFEEYAKPETERDHI